MGSHTTVRSSPLAASSEHDSLQHSLPVQDTTLNELWDHLLSGLVSSCLSSIVSRTQNLHIALPKSPCRNNPLGMSSNALAMLTKVLKNVITWIRQIETESV